jgi:NADH:ubiquinone oxidoreductase subunit 2 (subunit N)
MVIIFSLANIPPFTSFFAKLYIFKSVMHCSYSYIWWLAFPALITSILSSFYYLRILKFMLFENFKFNVLNTIKYNFNINYVVTKDNLSLNLYKLIHTFVYFILIFLTIIFLGFPVFSNSFIILVETLSISCINPHNLLEYLAFKNSNYII